MKHNTSEYQRLYRRSKNGIISHIYSHQKDNSKLRGHPAPSYSKDDLRDWLYSKEEFHHLFHLWGISNYDSRLKPSIDRIDPELPYSFSNMQLMTWGENRAKGHAERKAGKHKKMYKPVFKLKKGIIMDEYHSIREASRTTGVNQSDIVKCCKGKVKSAGGFTWQYVEGA